MTRASSGSVKPMVVKCHFNRFTVSVIIERDFRLLRSECSDAIHIGRVSVNLIHEASCCKIGESDASGVAVAAPR